MENKKPCPVDRGKLLIGLESHRHDDDKCSDCQYGDPADIKVPCGIALADDALAYIGWLEEKAEALEAEKPKSPYLTVYAEGDIMRVQTDDGEFDYRVAALAAVQIVMDGYRRVMSDTEYAEALGEMKDALADGSKFWKELEADCHDEEDAKCPE